MEYLNGQDCSLLLTATGEWGLRGWGPGPQTQCGDPGVSSCTALIVPLAEDTARGEGRRHRRGGRFPRERASPTDSGASR